jgi:lipopolysaccharide biosynthesis protein
MKILAHYLPQFHPIPENNDWWGQGFTEWSNVVKARPLFRGHGQPHVPADLGFYDLRVPEVREAQADLARRHGLTGFCYWHYWFGGRLLLERPLEEVLASGRPDFPFCLAWANQSWSGIWHGAPDRILIEQTYPEPEDDVRHFAYLRPAFEDSRYVCVAGKPVFFIFEPRGMPEPARFVERWQTMASQAGFVGLYLVACLGEEDVPFATHFEDGFDAALYYEFPVEHTFTTWLRKRLMVRGIASGPERFRYAAAFRDPPTDIRGRVIPTVWPNWDNTPRSGRHGRVILESTPERFGAHLRRALELVATAPVDEQMVMIKSWNEWAEGNYLEPDTELGLARFEALARVASSVDGERLSVSGSR